MLRAHRLRRAFHERSEGCLQLLKRRRVDYRVEAVKVFPDIAQQVMAPADHVFGEVFAVADIVLERMRNHLYDSLFQEEESLPPIMKVIFGYR